jgi:DNA repair exonuclease SbcCD ATPase subunit
MAKLPTTPMTVVRLTVDSFKKLRAADIAPDATGVVLVKGRNAAGKSSLIEAMLATLLGKKAAPELPINQEAHGADVVLDLGELVVRRHWKRGPSGEAETKLSIEDATGGRFSSPQAVLDNLVGRFADPVAFLSQKPDEQVKTVLAILGLDEKLEQLERLRDAQFEERRDLGRDADRLTKAEQTAVAAADDLPAPPDDEATVDELLQELDRANKSNQQRNNLQNGCAALVSKGRDMAARISQLETELGEAKAKRERLLAEYHDATAMLKAHAEVDTAPILKRIEAQQEAAKNIAAHTAATRISEEAVIARGAHAAAEERLEATRQQIAELLGSAKFPIEGMAYDADRKLLTINGIPLSQASQAERIKIAAAVAMAGDPPIRVLFGREGSLLDSESVAQLEELARARGFQVWLEVVASEPGAAGVWIEDGQATLNEHQDANRDGQDSKRRKRSAKS